MNLNVDLRRYRAWRWALTGVLVAIGTIPGALRLIATSDANVDESAVITAAVRRLPVTAAGRVEPRDGVLTIAAPASADTGPAIVTDIYVRQGAWVTSGTPLAALRGRSELEAALTAAQRDVELAQMKLAALQAGGKAEDIGALLSEVKSDQSAAELAASQLRRSRQLREEGILSAADIETQESKVEIANQTLEARRARLRGLSTVRPADLAIAQGELHAAQARVAQVAARLESVIVRAPADGRVLAIYAHPGQMVGADGVLAFGRTSEMFVDAEVPEEDLPRTHEGQKVRISGDVLASEVEGTVAEIGYLVGSREVFKTDPTAFADSRVVHVKIRATDPAALERFINARVTVVMQ
jgi:HlyD family secretion protein